MQKDHGTNYRKYASPLASNGPASVILNRGTRHSEGIDLLMRLVYYSERLSAISSCVPRYIFPKEPIHNRNFQSYMVGFY